jgi:aspartate 1-decarboxylase
VTRADLDYVGSITIDRDLIDAAGFLLHEKVDIYDVTNGSRLATYVLEAPRGSGEIGINGAAAHLVKPGDLVIIASYGWMKEKAGRKHQPNIVLVDDENRQTNADVETVEENPAQDPFGHLAAHEPTSDTETTVADAPAAKKKTKKDKKKAKKSKPE